jgi:hypothetical protein
VLSIPAIRQMLVGLGVGTVSLLLLTWVAAHS